MSTDWRPKKCSNRRVLLKPRFDQVGEGDGGFAVDVDLMRQEHPLGNQRRRIVPAVDGLKLGEDVLISILRTAEEFAHEPLPLIVRDRTDDLSLDGIEVTGCPLR